MHGNNNQWVSFKWYLPEGVTVSPSKEASFPIKATYLNKKEMEFEFMCEQTSGIIDMIADVSICGRHSYGLLKAKLIIDF